MPGALPSAGGVLVDGAPRGSTVASTDAETEYGGVRREPALPDEDSRTAGALADWERFFGP